MSKIKEQDILKLLRGKASAKKLKALEEWSSESKGNAMDLEQYQRIYDESDHLSDYTVVNTNKEWKKFSSSLNQSVSEVDLLHYFDGLATPQERKKVESWKTKSKTNKKDFNAFDRIISESADLTSYKKVDANSEWKVFSKTIKGQSTPPNLTVVGAPTLINEDIKITPQVSTKTYTPTPTITPPSTAFLTNEAPIVTPSSSYSTEDGERRGKRIFMWRSLAVAASILLLGAFLFNMWRGTNGASLDEQNQFLTYSTTDEPHILPLSDGSIISMDEETTLTYFRDVASVDERSVIIDGGGEFDVASNPDKPFIVRAKRSGVGVRVLGTRFRFEDSDEFIEIVENIEGSVRAYSIEDTTTFVVMTAGDRYGFDGVQFVNLNDRIEEYDGQQYDALYVLDYLMKESDWRVTSSPYTDFDDEAIITVDLNKPYEEILQDLKERSNFDYIKLACDGCYQITRFEGDY